MGEEWEFAVVLGCGKNEWFLGVFGGIFRGVFWVIFGWFLGVFLV